VMHIGKVMMILDVVFTTQIGIYITRKKKMIIVKVKRILSMTNLTGMTPDNFIKVEVSMYRVINNHDDCHPETCTCWDWRLVDGDNNCKKMSDDYKALQKLADTYNTQK